MYAVAIRFPAGRYHATGWDHHVNEGTVEWPPSPLRLLRALVATGFKLGWAPERVRAAVTALRGLPVYRLPPVTSGHTRHYMPTDVVPIEKGRELVFDAFHAMSNDPASEEGVLRVGWPDADPAPALRAELDVLWPNVAYLGRAESWAVCEPTAELGEPDVVPDGPGVEHVTLLAPETDVALAAWLATQPPAGKRAPWAPKDVWEVLLSDLGVIQRAGWSRPPGVREVRYGLRRAAVVAPVRRRGARASEPVHAVLFALSSAVLPDVGRTVSVADRFRRAAMSWSTRFDDDGERLDARRDDPDWGLAGKDSAGRPLEGHVHARWLPFGSDPRAPTLDRVLVTLGHPDGFSPRALAALRALSRVWGDDQHDLHTVFLGMGADAAAAARPLVQPSRVWVTDTPFVPTRHPKAHRDRIRDQILLGLDQLGLPPARLVEPLDSGLHGVPWHGIQTRREGGGAQARHRGVGVRLVFDEPVAGPIAIGWGSHFGMGRFRHGP
jgi:CRISPR-associated protein Csb2